MPQYFRTLPGLVQDWTQCHTVDVVFLYLVSRVSGQLCPESVCNPVVLPPNSLSIVLLCLFSSICIVQTMCAYSMDFVSVAKP